MSNDSYYEAYFYLYWACSAVNLVLGFMIIHEVFLDVFRPYHTFERSGIGHVQVGGPGDAAGRLRGGGFQFRSGHGTDSAAITTVQRCVRVAQCGLVLFLIVFSRYLGVSWRQQSFGIALGLGGPRRGVGHVALFAGGPMSQVTLHEINLVTYNLAILGLVRLRLS